MHPVDITIVVLYFAGMLGVTFMGLFLTPVFYVVLRAPLARRRNRDAA